MCGSNITGTLEGQNKYPKCLLLNARSLRNRILDFQELLLSDVAVTETWLDSSVLDHELQLYGYNIYRKDRSGRRGRGVLRAVKSHLTCFRRSDLETDMEMLACLIYTRPAFCLLFSVFYRPPGQNLDFSAKFGAFPNNYSSTNISTLIVLGDFNFPHAH